MQPDPVMTRASEPPDAVLRYAPHEDGLVDVHLPAGPSRPRPLVVYVHGGFWREEYDRTHARPLAYGLVGEGFVVASVEYRRGAGAWPDTSADLDAALSALPGLLDGLGVRTTTTTLVGHSAGGHLVLWLANERHPYDRVVALAPVGNLRKAVEHGMGSGAAVDFLGGTPEEIPAVYDAADPATRMRQRPPGHVVVVHGDRDQAVPVESSRGLQGRFDWLDYRELSGADHFDVIDPLSPAWSAVLDAVRG
ncbi:MAG: alpha/beta hydrolase [Nocardioidaceae bacterium]